jgi:hypothetical protein
VRHSLETTNQPLAVAVAVQTSDTAGAVLAKVQKIGSMFEPLVAGEHGMVALLTYSSKITVRQNFTFDAGQLIAQMRKLQPDGDSARMHDAILQAVGLFEARPRFQRVLIVIGESKDRGSEAKLEQAVTRVEAVNVTVYFVSYSVTATELRRGARSGSPLARPCSTRRPRTCSPFSPKSRAWE